MAAGNRVLPTMCKADRSSPGPFLYGSTWRLYLNKDGLHLNWEPQEDPLSGYYAVLGAETSHLSLTSLSPAIDSKLMLC